MLAFQLPGWVEQSARLVGTLAAFVIAVGVIVTKTPLGKIVAWFYRRLFGAPLTGWFRHQVIEAMSPAILQLRAENADQHAEVGHRLEDVGQELSGVKARLTLVEDAVRLHVGPIEG